MDLHTDTATSLTAGQKQVRKYPETASPPFPCLWWQLQFILQPHPCQKPASSKCYDEHQHTRQYFLVICLSQYTYATKVCISCCVLRAWKTSAPLPLLTLMSPATPHRSTRARSPHLVTLIIIMTKYIVHSTPSVAPKWLYRKLPSPQLQLKLFPPKGSEFKPQFF